MPLLCNQRVACQGEESAISPRGTPVAMVMYYTNGLFEETARTRFAGIVLAGSGNLCPTP
jgi:hypothetical protein